MAVKPEQLEDLKRRMAELKKVTKKKDEPNKIEQFEEAEDISEDEIEQELKQQYQPLPTTPHLSQPQNQMQPSMPQQVPQYQPSYPLPQPMPQNPPMMAMPQPPIQPQIAHPKPLEREYEADYDEEAERIAQIEEEVARMHNVGIFRAEMVFQLVQVNNHLNRIATALEKGGRQNVQRRY